MWAAMRARRVLRRHQPPSWDHFTGAVHGGRLPPHYLLDSNPTENDKQCETDNNDAEGKQLTLLRPLQAHTEIHY